jgi:hypothetical protein
MTARIADLVWEAAKKQGEHCGETGTRPLHYMRHLNPEGFVRQIARDGFASGMREATKTVDENTRFAKAHIARAE